MKTPRYISKIVNRNAPTYKMGARYMEHFQGSEITNFYKNKSDADAGKIMFVRNGSTGRNIKLNPAKRKSAKKPRTPAQRAATARMLAANKLRRNPTRSRKQVAARKKRNTKPGYYPNPKGRVSKRASYTAKKRLERLGINFVGTEAQALAVYHAYMASLKKKIRRNPARRVGKPRTLKPVKKYKVQVYKNKSWITLKNYAHLETAKEIGGAYADKFPRLKFRVFY